MKKAHIRNLIEEPLMERIQHNAKLVVAQVQRLRDKPDLLSLSETDNLHQMDNALQEFFAFFPDDARENYIINRPYPPCKWPKK